MYHTAPRCKPVLPWRDSSNDEPLVHTGYARYRVELLRTGVDLYELFGRYGSIRQIRIGNEPKTKGTAFVVYDDVMDVRIILDAINRLGFKQFLSQGKECS